MQIDVQEVLCANHSVYVLSVTRGQVPDRGSVVGEAVFVAVNRSSVTKKKKKSQTGFLGGTADVISCLSSCCRDIWLLDTWLWNCLNKWLGGGCFDRLLDDCSES